LAQLRNRCLVIQSGPIGGAGGLLDALQSVDVILFRPERLALVVQRFQLDDFPSIATGGLLRKKASLQVVHVGSVPDNNYRTIFFQPVVAVPVNHCHVSLRTCSLRASAMLENGSSISNTCAPRPYKLPPPPTPYYEP